MQQWKNLEEMNKTIAIYGASGHGKVVADIACACGYKKIIFIDDGDNEFINFDKFKEKYNSISIALGIGDNITREKIYKKTKEYGIKVTTLIHPSAIISDSVAIGEGTVIMPNVVINIDTKIGIAAIINSSSVIEHDNTIEDFVHISPNVALAGNIKVGKFTHIGIGSCAIQGLTIGHNCIVGAGSVVVRNIQDNKLAFGVPAKEIRDLSQIS
jgi:UDP-N-acetylbacillosamine N-acetyltransferase